jgi:hypothetical protein
MKAGRLLNIGSPKKVTRSVPQAQTCGTLLFS